MKYLFELKEELKPPYGRGQIYFVEPEYKEDIIRYKLSLLVNTKTYYKYYTWVAIAICLKAIE